MAEKPPKAMKTTALACDQSFLRAPYLRHTIQTLLLLLLLCWIPSPGLTGRIYRQLVEFRVQQRREKAAQKLRAKLMLEIEQKKTREENARATIIGDELKNTLQNDSGVPLSASEASSYFFLLLSMMLSISPSHVFTAYAMNDSCGADFGSDGGIDRIVMSCMSVSGWLP